MSLPGSLYLGKFSSASRSGEIKRIGGERYDLSISNGPADNWEKFDFKLDPRGVVNSIHGGGSLHLREKVARAYGLSSDNVLLIAGGTSIVNHHAVCTLLHRGGLGFSEWPVYDPLPATIRVSRADNAPEVGISDQWWIKRDVQNRFQVDLQKIADVLSHNPRLLLFTNPHNPSGIKMDNLREIMAQVDVHNSELEESKQTYVVVDEIYRDLSLVAPDELPCSATLSKFAVTTTSPTKCFGLSGLRMGILLASPEVVSWVLGYLTVSLVANPEYMEGLWGQFLEHRSVALTATLERQAKHLSLAADVLQSHSIPFLRPDGGTTFLISLPPGADDSVFCERLRAEFETACTPGAYFGCPGMIRVGYMVCTEEVLRIGLENVSKLWAAVAGGA